MIDFLRPARVPVAQGLSALAWIVEAAYFAWISRRLRARASPLSVFAVVLSMMGATQAGFTVRWYVWSGALGVMGEAETATWCTLYVLSAIEALAFVLAGETYRRLSR